jgi:hypothetical protein
MKIAPTVKPGAASILFKRCLSHSKAFEAESIRAFLAASTRRRTVGIIRPQRAKKMMALCGLFAPDS